MANDTSTISSSNDSTARPTIDLDTVRQHPVVSLTSIFGEEEVSHEQPNREAVKKSVKEFYDTIVANLTEEQLIEMVVPKDTQDVSKDTENLRSLLYTAALVHSGVDISKMSVGELTKDEINAVEHGTKNTTAANSTHHLLRSSFAQNAIERLTQAKARGDHHAEDALKQLQKMMHTDQTDDKYWKIIGLMPEQFAVKVAFINNLRKEDTFVTKLSDEEQENEWPDTRKQAVQKYLGLSEEQMFLVTTYQLHTITH